MNNDFKFIIPAEIVKSKDGEWKVAGLASSSSVDRQGEVILPGGIDATPIEHGKGFFNFDHDNSPENTIGLLDSYKKSAKGFFVEGRLFKNHSRAKAVYEIMTSLNKGDKGRVGMSVEGKVIERDPNNPSIIKRCVIRNVALTMNPVNQDTYADVIKSMSGSSQVDFESTGKADDSIASIPEAVNKTLNEPTFSASQVVDLIEKALGVGGGAGGGNYGNTAPAGMTGGNALSQEEMDKKKKAKPKMMSKSLYKSEMLAIVDKLQHLYPQNSRNEIWEAVKDRLETKFPEVLSVGKK